MNTNRHQWSFFVLSFLLLVGWSSAQDEEALQMNYKRLEMLLKNYDTELQGGNGVWQLEITLSPEQLEGIQGKSGDEEKGKEAKEKEKKVLVMCMADDKADRMRLITPIAKTVEMSREDWMKCMQSNFDRALDARYCVKDGVLWGAFIHPLASLDETFFHSAMEQVVSVSVTYGGLFSSGALQFGVRAPEDLGVEG